MTTVNAFSAWNLKPLSGVAFADAAAPLTLEHFRHLLGFALLAPSTHNSVPQAFHVDLETQSVAMYLRREHVLSASDPTGCEAVLSVGCAIENLAIAAAQYGVRCDFGPDAELTWSSITPSPTSSGDVLLGRAMLRRDLPLPDERARNAVLAGVLERKVLRTEYDKAVALTPALRAALVAAVHAAEGVELQLSESAPDKYAWGKLDELATKHKLEEPRFRRELGHWLLPNDDRSSVRGMRGVEFGLDQAPTVDLSARLRGEIPMAGDQLALMAREGRVGLTSASAVGVLSCADDTPAAALGAGRAFQRCALVAGAHGFAHALHTAVCNVPHARAMARATLMRSKRPPCVIFRLGKPLHERDLKRPHASRPPLDELLKPAPTR